MLCVTYSVVKELLYSDHCGQTESFFCLISDWLVGRWRVVFAGADLVGRFGRGAMFVCVLPCNINTPDLYMYDIIRIMTCACVRLCMCVYRVDVIL